jgi:hypothetical protein
VTFRVDKPHRCFREVFQFYAHVMSLTALRHGRVLARDLCAYNFEPDRKTMTIRSVGPDVLVLYDPERMLNFLRTGEGAPDVVEFDYSREESRPRAALPPVIPEAVPTLCTYLLGAAWERWQATIFEELTRRHGPRKPWEQDPDIQFFRHVRNGCFHGGNFNLVPGKHGRQIDRTNPPKWHGFVLEDDAAIHGQPVINNGKLAVTHVPHCLHDMGRAIDRVLGPLKA